MIGWLVPFVFCSMSLTLHQALNCNAPEGDPILHCYFKTELTANLLTLTQAGMNVLIGPTYVFKHKSRSVFVVIPETGSNMRKRKTRRCKSSLSRTKRSQRTMHIRATLYTSHLANLHPVPLDLRQRENLVLLSPSPKENSFALVARQMYVLFRADS